MKSEGHEPAVLEEAEEGAEDDQAGDAGCGENPLEGAALVEELDGEVHSEDARHHPEYRHHKSRRRQQQLELHQLVSHVILQS